MIVRTKSKALKAMSVLMALLAINAEVQARVGESAVITLVFPRVPVREWVSVYRINR